VVVSIKSSILLSIQIERMIERTIMTALTMMPARARPRPLVLPDFLMLVRATIPRMRPMRGKKKAQMRLAIARPFDWLCGSCW